MDQRRTLKKGSVLAFPGMECRIEEVIGCGSNAIVYKGWYLDQLQEQEKHHVLIKELFPYHKKQGIWRSEDNRIVVDEGEPEEFFQTHRESFEVGNRIHLRLLQSCPEDMGANLNSFEMNGTLYTILGYSGGRALDEELALQDGKGTLKRYVQLTIHLLDALEAFHDSGYLHLDISPDNALLIGRQRNERIMLIDYNSAKPIGDTESSYLSSKDGYSAPELQMGEEDSICEASDLYSVAAVFYRMLMGRAMTLDEALAASTPDAAQSPCMDKEPQTVKSLVRSILRRGLATMPEDRYQTIAQMRRDFAELIDRIDCVGVTHWALWECGRRSIGELIRVNPSLSYVKDEAGMYPIRLEQDGERILLEELVQQMLSSGGESRVTVSAGGMGKTTLLLKMAQLCTKRYMPGRPAVFYISLSGWNDADPQYIRKQILKTMRYGRENNTVESAMHELELLMGRTIRSGKTEAPTVLLLLDGLNEVRGDAAPLIQEINLLSKMAGVRIMAASRSEVPALEMKTNRILNLTVEDIKKATAEKGVLMPQSEQLLQLTKTPLILSIYLAASQNSQQLNISDQDDLMRAYLESLHQKEVESLMDNSPQKWQADVALTYVLPAIAAETIKTQTRLTETQMLHIVQQCCQVLRSKILQKAFPQWIGRSREIFGETQSDDAWMGLMIHDLLWKRLGLLMRDEHGGYGVFHQMIAEYLAKKHRENAAKIRRYRMIRSSVFGTAAMLVFMLGFGVYAALFMVTPYKQSDAEYVLSQGRSVYDWYMSIYEEMLTLIDLGEDELTLAQVEAGNARNTGYALLPQRQIVFSSRMKTEFEKQYDAANGILLGYGRNLDGIYAKDAPTIYPSMAESRETAMTVYAVAGQPRKVVSWSGMPLDAEGIMQLYNHLWERQNYYINVFLPEFKRWYYGSRAATYSGVTVMKDADKYLDAARQMILHDAQVCQLLYDLYISGHMTTTGLVKMESTGDEGHSQEVLAGVRLSMRDYGEEAATPTLLQTVRQHAYEQKGIWNGLMMLFTGTEGNEARRMQDQALYLENIESLRPVTPKYQGLQ